MNVILKQINNSYVVTLHKVNEDILGEIPSEVLISMSRNIDDIDEIEVVINKYYTSQINKEKKEYYFYNEFKNERLIALDGEFFVIKDITEDEINKTKTVKAYGYEKKLEKNDIVVEGIGFMLLDSDEPNLIFCLSDYMYDEIGWRIGHVDESVRYTYLRKSSHVKFETFNIESNGNLVVDCEFKDGNLESPFINKEPKMRWQESLSSDWYTFLSKTVAEQFESIAVFDRKNKLVNYFAIDGFGENIGIALSRDNYIKSLTKVSDSNEIITRLKLSGNAEKCVVQECIPSGYDYIENYSYFIENGEMSEELINALIKHEELIKDVPKVWLDFRNKKIELEEERLQLENLLFFNLQEFDVCKSVAKDYREKNDIVNATIWDAKCGELSNERFVLETQIKEKQQFIDNIVSELNKINVQCRRYSATDDNGNFIFTQKLLDELKLFVFQGTYSDDSFHDAMELISVGERDLNDKCKPTETFTIDNENFVNRLIDNGFRQHWSGELGLGDIIIIYDSIEDKEDFIFLVSYTQDFKSNSLLLELSNKKSKDNNKRNIAMWMKSAKMLREDSMKNRYVVNQLKNYKYNL